MKYWLVGFLSVMAKQRLLILLVTSLEGHFQWVKIAVLKIITFFIYNLGLASVNFNNFVCNLIIVP